MSCVKVKRGARHCRPLDSIREGLSSTVMALISLARGLSLLLSGRPRTPLRVLCIVAFDTLHRMDRGKWLTMHKLKMLAELLDFGAFANAAFDGKKGGGDALRVPLRLLSEAGIRSSVAEYRRRLGKLENSRPPPGGDHERFRNVRLYREAVARLSLGIVATVARGGQLLDEAIAATFDRGDLNLLFRIAMQCQIIDDVLDYSRDKAAGLPSFLTACGSLPRALELTQRAARSYAEGRPSAQAGAAFPLRAALFLVSMVAKLAVSLRC